MKTKGKYGIRLIGAVAVAAGRLLAWQGRGTRIARGFAALRMRTNLHLWAEVPIRADGQYAT